MSFSFTSSTALKKNSSSKRRTVLYALGLSLLIYVLVAVLFSLLKIYHQDNSQQAVLTPLIREKSEQKPESPMQEAQTAALAAPQAIAPPLLQLETPQTLLRLEVSPTLVETSSFGLAGAGLGGGGLGLGSGLGLGNRGTGGGGASFFNVRQTGQRFAFVIDLSGSIRSPMQKTIQRELSRSLRGFNATSYQIICFTQSAWVLGEKKKQKENRKGENGKDIQSNWLGKENIANSLQQIEKLTWGGGTNWRAAFNTTLAMNPKPDVIYFMTDGVDKSEDFAQKYGAIMRENRIELVCIGLVNKTAAEAMVDLAREARGKVVWAKEDNGYELLHDFSR